MIQQVCKNATPLCFTSNNDLLCYKYGKLLFLRKDKVLWQELLFSSFKETQLARIRIIARLLRTGIRAAIMLSDSEVLLSIKNTIHEFNLNSRKLSIGYKMNGAIRPLIFTKIENLEGFDDCIVFGGYLGNANNKPVHIYKRIEQDNWGIVYTFGDGKINHIHNIVADVYRKCLWIFTGDFNESAAIWKVTDNFKKVERICSGNQLYRGCVAYPLPEGIIYATDTPFTDNSICLFDGKNAVKIASINGSCIYGCKWKENFVFSTTVEGDGRNQTRLQFFTNRKRGSGIRNEYVYLYTGNLLDGFKTIYKQKKDRLPFLFQFGVFKFPYGDNITDNLYFQQIATSRNDLRLMRLYKENKLLK